MKVETIGICSPAAPVNEIKLKSAIEEIRKSGYKVVTATSTFGNIGLFAATDEVRCRELEEMFLRDDVDAVFCSRGGVGSSRLFEILNTKLIAESRKPFLGFSDITALQWMLFAKHEFVSFTGPLATEWEGSVTDYSRKSALQMLMGKSGQNLFAGFNLSSAKVLRGRGKVTGKLFPGNLTMITTLPGTPYLPDLRNAILFIEDVGEPPYRVDRMLFHLRNAGMLTNLSALLVGDFQMKDDPVAFNYLKTSLLEATRGMDFPILLNLPYGHGAERMTLPVGIEVTVDLDHISLSLNSPAAKDSRP